MPCVIARQVPPRSGACRCCFQEGQAALEILSPGVWVYRIDFADGEANGPDWIAQQWLSACTAARLMFQREDGGPVSS